MPRRRKYFVIKHDLASLQLLPGFIWNSEYPKSKVPRGFKQVKAGDHWLAFAYKQSSADDSRRSLITGAYECAREAVYSPMPGHIVGVSGNSSAWQIQGVEIAPRLDSPVEIQPLPNFIRRPVWHGKTVTKVSAVEFRRICKQVWGSKSADGSRYVSAAKRGLSRDRALACLKQLVTIVLSQGSAELNPVTYQDLAARIGRKNRHGKGHPRGMGRILGIMGHLIKNIRSKWSEAPPKIQTLVVCKSGQLKGLPDHGLKEFWPRYNSWTKAEKRARVRREYRRISEFGSRWNQILEALGVPPAVPKGRSTPAMRYSHGGGESPDHRRLQEFVRDNPKIVGASSTWLRDENYVLPSLDEIDVLFRSPTKCLIVEIKSKVSDCVAGDYERGIYQTIKYAAIMEAMFKAGAPESRPQVEALLLLETSLPAKLRHLSRKLGVRVITNIRPRNQGSQGAQV